MSRAVAPACAAMVLGAWLAACRGDAGKPPPPASMPAASTRLVLADVEGGGAERSFDKEALARGDELERIDSFDPYYRRDKRYWAVPLRPLLLRAFGAALRPDTQLLLKAADGYAVPIEAARLVDGTAYLALADAEHPASWDPIGPQRADPGGFYLVWRGADHNDLELYPRPWSLVRIERVRFEAAFPFMAPPEAAPSSPAAQGFAIFRRECVRCHAINREGGHVGPDLNVPQSIVEYRPVTQIRAYIRNPASFRYGAMPAHPHLSDGDLDALVAYFTVMRDHKHDPEAGR